MRYGKYSTTVEHKLDYPSEAGDVIDVDVEIDVYDVVGEETEYVADCLQDFGYRVIKTNSLLDNFKLDFVIENLHNIKLEDLEALV